MEKLNQRQVALIKEIKAKAFEVGELVDKMKVDISADRPDARWLSIGTTSLQQGFQALVRSVEQPETF